MASSSSPRSSTRSRRAGKSPAPKSSDPSSVSCTAPPSTKPSPLSSDLPMATWRASSPPMAPTPAASATKSTPATSVSTWASPRPSPRSPSVVGARVSSAIFTPRPTTAWSSIPRPRLWWNAGPAIGAASSEGVIMAKLMVGNAPCSWGTLEFEGGKGEQIPFSRMLDELVEAGYTGTELGDWGYMPTAPAELQRELTARGLVMLGAFVPVALKDKSAHPAGIANAVKTARLLAAVASEPAPYLVLADNTGSVPERTRLAGRVPREAGLSPAEWRVFAAGADELAHVVYQETGLRTVFHHHCAGYVETPDEIATLLSLTRPDRLGLVFDTGHYCYGAAGDRKSTRLNSSHLGISYAA